MSRASRATPGSIAERTLAQQPLQGPLRTLGNPAAFAAGTAGPFDRRIMTGLLPRTYWRVEHPEVAARLVVAARTDDDARAIAWRRWYGREPATEFEKLLRAAFSATDSGEAAE